MRKWFVRNWYLIYPLVLVAGCVLLKKYAPHKYERFGEIVGFSITDVLTIYLAVLAIHFARHHNRDLKRVEGALSTYRKGSFPHYLSEIGKLAESACCLDILVDCLDFGSFFAPDVHETVHNQICKLARNHARVRILVCGKRPEPLTGPSGMKLREYKNAGTLVKNYCQVLRNDPGFKDWIATMGSPDDEIVKRFNVAWLEKPGLELTAELRDQCIAVCSGRLGLGTSEGDPLRRILLQLRQLWFAKDLPRFGVQIRAQSTPEPMFFWIRYKNEGEKDRHVSDDAMFTFAVAARGPGQLGYSTHDPDLLNTFRAIFEKKWNDSDPKLPNRTELEWLTFLRLYGQLRTRAAASQSSV
jgi:hypothetical protein